MKFLDCCGCHCVENVKAFLAATLSKTLFIRRIVYAGVPGGPSHTVPVQYRPSKNRDCNAEEKSLNTMKRGSDYLQSAEIEKKQPRRLQSAD
jgi:hypothetical protein